MAYASFEDLEVWKKSCRLTVEICSLVKDIREYAFKDQMMRAALSIPSNIAEGAERNSIPDFIRFLHIAKGSAAELRTQLYIAGQAKIIDRSDGVRLIKELKKISSQIHSLIKYQQGLIS
ncbi:MAG: four helix bundle protein [Desulfovibrionales bacterium]